MSTNKANILIVDDYAPNLIALKVVLNSPRYNLVEAASGPEAIKLCNEMEFALIVLDIQMPGMDGFETAKKVKSETLNKDVPIMFVTAVHQADPFVKKGFEVGAIDYFGKPFEPDILKAKVSIYTDLYLKTKRLEETEQLLKTHDQIKILLDAIPVGVIVADIDGRIYQTNEEAQRIWCGVHLCTLDQYDLFKGWWSETGAPLSAKDWGLARALTKSEISKDEMIDIEAQDGQKKTVLHSAYPIHAKNGQVLGAVAIIQDVTVRREVADDIHRKVAELMRDAQLLREDTVHRANPI